VTYHLTVTNFALYEALVVTYHWMTAVGIVQLHQILEHDQLTYHLMMAVGIVQLHQNLDNDQVL
jgi:hypothetical protein